MYVSFLHGTDPNFYDYHYTTKFKHFNRNLSNRLEYIKRIFPGETPINYEKSLFTFDKMCSIMYG